MGNNINKYIAVAYRLYTIDNGKSELVEEATDKEPFQFISGFGLTLDKFEENIVGLEQGGEFDFILTKEEAYGDHEEERVLDLDKEIFRINGHFDHENIYKDAVIPLQNEDGNRFYGKVLAVGTDKVKVDLNHPLAGNALNFKGHVVESREASKDEIQGLINRMDGEGCCCGHHCDDGDGCHHGHHDQEDRGRHARHRHGKCGYCHKK